MSDRSQRRPPPTPPKLKRDAAQISLPRKLLFVCEGATERAVLDGLRQRWRIAHASVQVIGQAGDPMGVVDRCLEAPRADTDRWAVFDRDEHVRWR